MRRTTLRLGIAALVAVAATAYALEGKNGYAATQLFLWGDVRTQVEYPGSFTGPRWPDLERSHLGGWGSVGAASMAVEPDGDLAYLVGGSRGATSYLALIHFDGTRHRQVLHTIYDGIAQTGGRLDVVRVSPVTAGRLTAGHPVCLRQQIPGQAELVSVDPDTWGETLVHAFPGPRALRFDVAADGTIFALLYDDGLHRLDWNASTNSYDDNAVVTSFPPNQDSDVLSGPDGFAYTFSDDEPSWHLGVRNTRAIYRVDPVSGAHSVYADVQNWTFVWDWTFDSNGTLFLSMGDSRSRKYVAEVVPGATTGRGDAISSSDLPGYGLAGGPDGKLLLRELVSVDGNDGHLDPMHELAPSSGGGGSGGGGNGNGKGRNK